MPNHHHPKNSVCLFLLWISSALSLSQGAFADATITFVDQPTGIDLVDYASAWSALDSAVNHLRQKDREAAKADLQRLIAAPTGADGALNLLAQLEREDGKLDQAESLIVRAIAANPRQHRHYFQQALISFARLLRASGLGRWSWQQKTKDAYQKAFELDPKPIPYRYYLAYSLVQIPVYGGGDKDKALRLAHEGVEMGQKEFLVVRADIHRLRGEPAAAFEDYDRALAKRVFKLSSFLGAGQLALEKKDLSRARSYFEWGIRGRPENAHAHEGLGDYFMATGDTRAAAAAFTEALRLDPKSTSVPAKLATARAQKTGAGGNMTPQPPSLPQLLPKAQS